MAFPIPLYLLVLIPVGSGAVGYFLPRRWYHLMLYLMHAVVLALSVATFIEVRWSGDILHHVAGWPDWIAIKLLADSQSAPLVVLTTIFFAATFVFSTRADYTDRTFLFLFVLLESALIGVFLSADLFNIYVLLELGMLAIAILIMYERDKQSVYDAMLYLMMNFIAMSFMLLGIGYLYRITGVLDLDALTLRLPELENPRSVIIPYALIMTSITLKSALFPLFSWLPRAHGAPSAPGIVSAILSGVQVKAGVYLLVRLSAVFEPLIDASFFFLILGFITSIVGFLLAIAQTDIKLILAYHTVSQVGLIVVGLNLGTEVAFWGGMYHVINHALFKGLLFLTAGVIIEEYGSRSYKDIRGVLRHMPAVGIGTLAGILGITGAPLFNGSISKYFIQQGLEGNLAEAGLYLINLGTTLSFVKYARILFGKAPESRPAHRDPWVAVISLLFGFACLAGGILGGPTVALVYGPAYSASGALSLEKLLTFLATLGVAIFLYIVVVQNIGRFLAAVRRFKFTFNQITVFLTLY
ncbi:MAG: complex I subunit 5 family protein, partial [Alkalispirochaetaceae bacterium]